MKSYLVYTEDEHGDRRKRLETTDYKVAMTRYEDLCNNWYTVELKAKEGEQFWHIAYAVNPVCPVYGVIHKCSECDWVCRYDR